MILFQKDSPPDLLLRGFSRAVITERTGIDTGYNGISLRQDTRGIDRFQYRVAHVQRRYGSGSIETALQSYAAGALKADVLATMGLGTGNTMSLRIFFTALGYSQEYQEANGRARHHHSSEGVRAKYGVDNPFALIEVQRRGAATRRAKYGADYTFAKGSVLEQQARASRARTVAAKKRSAAVVETA